MRKLSATQTALDHDEKGQQTMTLTAFLQQAGQRATRVRICPRLKTKRFVFWDGSRMTVSNLTWDMIHANSVDAVAPYLDVIQVQDPRDPTFFNFPKG